MYDISINGFLTASGGSEVLKKHVLVYVAYEI